MRHGGQQKSEIESWSIDELWRYHELIWDLVEKEWKARG